MSLFILRAQAFRRLHIGMSSLSSVICFHDGKLILSFHRVSDNELLPRGGVETRAGSSPPFGVLKNGMCLLDLVAQPFAGQKKRTRMRGMGWIFGVRKSRAGACHAGSKGFSDYAAAFLIGRPIAFVPSTA